MRVRVVTHTYMSSNTRVQSPKLDFFKSQDKMSEQVQKCSDIIEFWSDMTEIMIIFVITLY